MRDKLFDFFIEQVGIALKHFREAVYAVVFLRTAVYQFFRKPDFVEREIFSALFTFVHYFISITLAL